MKMRAAVLYEQGKPTPYGTAERFDLHRDVNDRLTGSLTSFAGQGHHCADHGIETARDVCRRDTEDRKGDIEGSARA